MKCEAVLNKHYMRVVKDYHDGQCKKKVKFKIYNKFYCDVHAAMKSFSILNNRGELLEIK